MHARALLIAAFGTCAVACGAAVTPASTSSIGPSAISYEAKIRSSDPWVIEVRATFAGGAQRGAIAFPDAVQGVVVEEAGRERSPEQVGRGWSIACEASCTVRYAVDLTAAAEMTGDSAAVAMRSGGDVLALGSTWLLKPEPAAPMTVATLRVETRDPASDGDDRVAFAAPFPRDASGKYKLVARDIGALGYTAWGRFRTAEVTATHGTIEAVLLRGERRLSDETIVRWVRATALAMDAVYGRFPIERAMIALVPSEGSGAVDFGRTVPAGGASIVVSVGDRAGAEDLYEDWVLAHEMIHLGVPSMPRDGTWIDEGLATYYGPIVRARAGLMPGDAAWAELARMLPKGVATAEEPVLAEAEDHDRVYFGGSLFALTADVEIRRKTSGKRTLDDALRQVLAEGGKGTEVWSATRLAEAMDRGAGVPVVRPLLERARARTAPCGPALAAGLVRAPDACAPDDVVSLQRLMGDLGVHPGTSSLVDFDDRADLAWIRRGLVARHEELAAVVTESAGLSGPGAGARERAGLEKP